MRSLILGFSIVLYDMLNDDDTEIRDDAAKITSRLLRAQGVQSAQQDAVPMITIQRLGRFFSASYSDSKELCREALRRLTGTIEGRSVTRPFGTALAEARSESTSLFAQEKQNLYKDDALDATFWASVLVSLSPNAAKSKDVEKVTQWVLDGLAVFSETAKAEKDGPLGWSTKPEVFVLGIRVLCAADVLLRWIFGGALEVKLALWHFATLGWGAGINGIWLEKADRMLEKTVVRSLQRVYASLPAA